MVWLGLARKPLVKRLLHFFTQLHNYETFRHIYTRQSSDTFSSWHRVCMENSPSALSDNLTSASTSKFRAKRNRKQIPCQAQQQANSVPSATTSKFRAKRINKQIPCQAQQQANSVPSATTSKFRAKRIYKQIPCQAQQFSPFIGKQGFRRTAIAFLLTIPAQIVLCKVKLAIHLI